MSENIHSNTGQPEDGGQTQGAHIPPREDNARTGAGPKQCAFDSLRNALNDGARQARDAAERAIPKLKAAVSDATYWIGFGASFATVFSCEVVKELAPAALKTGGRDGAAAGKKAVADFVSELRPQSRPASAPAASPPAQDIPGAAAESGVA